MMNLLGSILLAQGTAPNPILQFVPLLFLFVVFYFLLIRPQRKRQKDHEKLVSQVKTGDKVVTSSGIHGVVANVKDKTLLVKIADNVKVEFDRSAVVFVEPSNPAS